MTDVDKIIRLLEEGSIEKRIAAAIVLGELRAKAAQDALVTLLGSEVPVLQRHAIEALTKIGMPKKLVPKLFASLTASVADVRDAARAAIASFGEEIVPTIRERIPQAEPVERKALEAILAELGGKDAFATLLAGLASTAADEAKQAAIAMRAHVKNAGARERRSYLSETEKFLAKQKKANAPPTVIAAAIKIMGYLEDEHATGSLLEYASDAKQPAVVRQEALIALRFALGQKKADEKKVIAALVDAAEADDRTLAHTALHTLGSMQLPAGMAKRIEKLAVHPDYERARFVLEMLGRQEDAEATRVLVHAATTLEKKRAEIACAALANKEEAALPLAKALLETKDVDRGWMLKKVLHPIAKKLPPAMRKQILETAMDRLGEGERGWEALLDIARDADADGVATSLRALAQKLRRAKNDDKAAAVFGLLCRSDRATDEDRYALASLELARGPKDTRIAIRAADESLKMLSQLATRGFDVGSALRKDKSLELEALYYVGFHFAEAKSPLGEELLEDVVKKGGRTKVGKMAKNKLALLQGSASAEAD
jgi:HEAT repeat protein